MPHARTLGRCGTEERSASLFARTEPKHKQELVQLLQQQKEICAMVRHSRRRAMSTRRD